MMMIMMTMQLVKYKRFHYMLIPEFASRLVVVLTADLATCPHVVVV